MNGVLGFSEIVNFKTPGWKVKQRLDRSPRSNSIVIRSSITMINEGKEMLLSAQAPSIRLDHNILSYLRVFQHCGFSISVDELAIYPLCNSCMSRFGGCAALFASFTAVLGSFFLPSGKQFVWQYAACRRFGGSRSHL
jgi:hypothetical protein